MFDIITIGDSTLDTFLVIDDATVSCDIKKEHCKLLLNYADKIPITNTAQSVGGNAANIAVGTKKLGLKSAIVTELGDDINGFVIKNELERAKVDTRFVKMIKTGETRYAVILNFKSERTILSYHVKRNYTLPKLPKTEWIYYTSLGKTFEKIQSKLVSYLKKHPGTKLAFNPGSYQKKYGLKAVKKILPYTTLLIVNKGEAEILVGKKRNEKTILRALHNTGAKMVVLTDSTNGSWSSDGQAMYFMPTYNIAAVARTGAGDAYSSGFLSALMYKKTMKEAMQWGTANACGVIRQFGAQKGLFTKTKIENLVKKYPKIKPKSI